MKETLDEQSRKELVVYRLDRANETMQEARLLARENFYNAAVNRLYYSCFYAVQALLLKNQITVTTHAGVKSMLGLHFVAKGILPVEYGKTFNTLFEKRHSSDYEAFAYCDKSLVDELIPLADTFVSKIKELLTDIDDR